MDITAEKFTVVFTHNELWSTAFDIQGALKDSIKTHWVNHQQNWQSGEKERLYRCKMMFVHLGRPDLYDDIIRYAEKCFSEFKPKTT